MTSFERKLKELDIPLLPVSIPKGNYASTRRAGSILYSSGHLPTTPEGELLVGKVGSTLTVEEGQLAARSCGLALLATLNDALGGDITRVRKILKVTGYINCVDGFTGQSDVMDGFSDLLVEVFGPDKGRAARSSIGTNALPGNVAVEVEIIAEIKGPKKSTAASKKEATPSRDMSAGADEDVLTTSVYVRNLSWDTTSDNLKNHFAEVGTVVSADVKEKDDGRSKGWGIVTFETIEEVRNAIQSLNQSELDGRSILVREDKSN